MVITMRELAVSFNRLDYNTLLKDWQWLIGSTKLPILLTAAGDAFVQDAEGGPIYFLDVGKGELHAVAGNDKELHSLLADKDFVANHLAAGRVRALIQADIRLEPGQIYSFQVPPVLGGQYTLDNITKTTIPVHFSQAGQAHQQAKGTQI